MTQENLKKHYARLKWLSSGEFTERDFDYIIPASDNPNGKKGESGRMTMGDMSTSRRNLIMQDAQRTLNIFLKKYPEFKEPEPKEIPKPQTKPKEKK